MCGIVGYIGGRDAQPILLQSLKRLEYRGYDSCGIAVLGSTIKVSKDVGRVQQLEKALPRDNGKLGIGHTRWATHGKPSRSNAHPHTDCSGNIAVVHNGVIDNSQQLRDELTGEGHRFLSETDTEVMPHLIERYYQGDLEQAVKRALADVKGSYALIVLAANHEELLVARNDSPLVIGVGDGENFVASDVPALLDYTDRVIYLEDGDVGIITGDAIRLLNQDCEVRRETNVIPWTLEDAQKGGYEHFMLKEIHEQPRVIRDTLGGYISAIEPAVDLGLERTDFEDVLLLACGTSYHAGLVGRCLLERIARVPVRVEIASEFSHSDAVLGKTWVIGITQSGETADLLGALKKAKQMGCKTLAITNCIGSSVTRIADQTFYIKAHPEISVAATKSFIAQLMALYLLALSEAKMDIRSLQGLIGELSVLPDRVQLILDDEEKIARFGKYLSTYDSAFFIARGINFPVALEGALKLKEISYIHAEGYPAGEIKHGPFALLTPDTPVIAITARDDTYEAMLANIKEIKARESPVIALAGEDDEDIEQFVDHVIRVPGVSSILSPVINSVALQLLAYYAAKERGCPIDMPRNLAKSVTVK
ncbi:MAG TPA: glutamine--fructose-6-phosphate transaminase (isomerizing) [Dehalococcoidia bacterium]|nr:glutamine--fructose-6-phosphate transaminase (isomerizing) [Dehalococcoidia bacterium]